MQKLSRMSKLLLRSRSVKRRNRGTHLTSPGTIREHHMLQLRPNTDQDLDFVTVPAHSDTETNPAVLLVLRLVHSRCQH